MTDTTGPDLRRERLMADVKVTVLARELGKSRQYVHEIEGRAKVKPETVRLFRAALLTVRSITEDNDPDVDDGVAAYVAGEKVRL